MTPRLDRYRSVWIRFTILYALLLIVPTLLGTLYYRATISSYVTLVDRIARERVERVHEVLELIQDEIERIANHIEIDRSLREVLESDGVPTSAGVISALHFKRTTSLVPYSLTNRYISRYYIVSARSGSAYGPNTAFSLDTFLRYVVRFPGVAPDAWNQVFLSREWKRRYLPAREITTDGVTTTIVPYFDSHGVGRASEAVVLVLLDANRLRTLLTDVFVESHGYAAILDPDGEVIVDASSGIDTEDVPTLAALAGDSMEASPPGASKFHVVTSRRPTWTVVAAYADTSVTVNARHAGATTLGIVIGLVLVGIGIALAVIMQAYRPISSTLAELYRDPPPKSQSGGSRGASIGAQITSGLRGLRELADQYREQAREHRLWELLVGVDPRGTSEGLDEVGIGLPAPPYAVVVCRLTRRRTGARDGPASFVLGRARLREHLQELFSRHISPVTVGQTDIAVVVPNTPESRSGLHELVSWAHASLREMIQVGVGREVTDLRGLSRSFRDAESLARVASIGERPAIDFYRSRDPANDGSPASGPDRDEEDAIVRAVRQGDRRRLTAEIHALDHEYAGVTSGPQQTQTYVQWLELLASRIAEEQGLPPLDVDPPLVTDIVRYHAARSTLLEACERVTAGHSGRQDLLFRRVQNAVDEDLCNPELSLSLVAAKLDLSQFYLSRIMPEALGDNFRNYVERSRMAVAAREIRDNPAEAISSIMTRCGYRHTNTFGRAFRRVHGVTPGSYRRYVVNGPAK